MGALTSPEAGGDGGTLNKHPSNTSVTPINADEIDLTVQKRLVRKCDLIVLPALCIIYFTNSIDRANLGNAKTAGLEKDLGLHDNQYSLLLILFYIPYGLLNIPSTVLAKRFSPGLVIPLLMAGWGICATCSAAVQNYGGIVACRVLLGAFEAGFFPSAVFYCTLFYTRREMAKRVAYFYMMGFVANAFSGLIAYRVFQFHAKLEDWRYLFIIEGSLTIFLALIALLFLPRSVAESRLFTAEEKRVAAIRYAREIPLKNQEFRWSDIWVPLRRGDTWAFAGMSLSYGVACASVSNFLPTMIKRLGYSTVRTQLFTIAPNLSGALFITLSCILSDYTQNRSLFVIIPSLVSMIGFILLGTLDMVDRVGVGYFCTFLLTFGTFTPAVIVPAWQAGNNVTATGRAAAVGLLVGMQNLGGIISSVAFRDQDAPVYRPALIVSGVFQGATIMLAMAMGWYYWRKNRRLERVTGEGGVEEVAWRYVL